MKTLFTAQIIYENSTLLDCWNKTKAVYQSTAFWKVFLSLIG